MTVAPNGATKELRISVVVPARNESDEIEAALRSIGRDAVHEILVVDGGSDDDTSARARALGVRVVEAQAGRSTQMNAGAALTSGDVLLFLHADTRLPAGWSGAVREAVHRGAVGGRFDVELRGRHAMLRIVGTFMNARSRWSRIYTGDQAIFVRRDVFERLGGYETIPLMEDIAMSRRLKREGPVACLRLRVSTSGRRWETHGVFRTIGLMWSLRLAYFLGVPPDRLAGWYRRERSVRGLGRRRPRSR